MGRGKGGRKEKRWSMCDVLVLACDHILFFFSKSYFFFQVDNANAITLQALSQYVPTFVSPLWPDIKCHHCLHQVILQVVC